MRAVAMLMVVATHIFTFSGNPSFPVRVLYWHGDLGRIFPQLPSGVDLFMVLSGFCLFLPLCKSQKALRQWRAGDFYRRRVRRIVPPYYAAIAFAVLLPEVLVVVFHILHQPAKWQPLDTTWVYAAHLLFVQTLFADTFGHVNASLWSMALEAQFYLVFPLVVYAFRRLGLKALVGMVLISILYRLVAAHLTAHLSFWPQFRASVFFLGRWMQFAAGMAAAWYVARHRHRDQWRSAAWGTMALLASVAVFVLTCALTADLAWERSLLLAAAFSGMIVAFCVSRTPLRVLVENRVIVSLGFMSYSIFLIHWPICYYLSQMFNKILHAHGRLDFCLLATAGFAILVAIASAFFVLFEKPFLNAPKLRFAPGTAPAEAPMPAETAAP